MGWAPSSSRKARVLWSIPMVGIIGLYVLAMLASAGSFEIYKWYSLWEVLEGTWFLSASELGRNIIVHWGEIPILLIGVGMWWVLLKRWESRQTRVVTAIVAAVLPWALFVATWKSPVEFLGYYYEPVVDLVTRGIEGEALDEFALGFTAYGWWAVWALAALIAVLLERERPKHACVSCGYDVRRIEANVCPECGTKIHAEPCRFGL